MLEVPEVLEATKDELCLLDVMRCVLLCVLEAVEGRLYLLEVLEVPGMMRCVLLSMLGTLEALESGLCLLEVSEVMRCMLLCMLEVPEVLGVMR